MKIAAIIPAAGQGRRLKTKKIKPFVLVAGKPILVYTIENLKRSCPLEEIILVVSAAQNGNFKRLLKRYGLDGIRLVAGGRTRSESVKNGLEHVSEGCNWVLVHDAARPLISKPMLERLIMGAKKTGAAIVALPVTSTVKKVRSGTQLIQWTEDRGKLCLAQTPQIFRKDLLIHRYAELGKKALRVTDEAALFDGSRVKIGVVPGETSNVKITTLEDIELFKFYLKHRHRGRV